MRLTTKGRWVLYFFIGITFSFPGQAQTRSESIQPIILLIQTELKKAGVQVPVRNYNGKPDNQSIQLELLNARNLSNYGLSHAPDDAFYIKSTNRSVYIGSATTSGLRNGAFWYLHHLGFRYYFPGSTWTYVPQLQTAFKPVEKTAIPSFTHRRIWYAYGTGSKKADSDYQKWFEANLLGGEDANAGHSYDAIVKRNREVFLQHPEYFAQNVAKGQIPPDPKFEPGNEALVQLLIRDALNQIETGLKKNGQLPGMISMDPSDGGGFSTSASASKIGGASEQTFYLANRVAKEVRKKYPSVKIGLYAYNFHSLPPKLTLEPNIVVFVATALNQSAYRTDELIGLWKKKGVRLGIRDYYGVMAWDWDMPGQPNGSRIAYVTNLKNYYEADIRLFTAETNIGWISRGVGHYMATQLLWDVNRDPEKIKTEFFRNMFGNAAQPIKNLFESWQQYRQPVPLEGDLYSWYILLKQAGELETNELVHDRLNEIKQYLHYVYLFKQWKANNSDQHLINLLNYAYRVQDKGIVASYPLFRRLANSAVKGKANMRFNDPKAVWKQVSKPVDEAETGQNFDAVQRALNPEKKTIIVTLPNKLGTEKNTVLSRQNSTASLPVKLRGGHTIVFHTESEKASINLLQGLIKAHEYKTLRLAIYPYKADLSTSGSKPLLQRTIEPRKPQSIALGSLPPGTYIAIIDDARNGFTLSFSGDVAYGIVAGSGRQAWTFGRNNLVLEVRGVQSFVVQNDGVLTLKSPKGRVIDLQKQKGVFTVKLQEGEEGLWQVQRQSGKFSIQGVMPLLSADKNFLIQNDE